MSIHGSAVCLLIPLALVAASASRAEGLITNGDLELESAESPPPGWTMWGAQKYKTPENYTRGTDNPHGGTACLRIHHPADTAGYLVTSPEHAIRPTEGKLYRVSFWARTDVPGPSLFGFTGYETIDPFVDAPAPAGQTIDVGTEWQKFTCEANEGWDFLAEECRYLMLRFHATTDAAQAKTLWIDDVVVTEEPSPLAGRLVNERTLDYEPLQHRLTEGEALDLTVHADVELRPTPLDVAGISFHRVAGWTGQPYDREGNYTLPDETERAIRELHLPMTRFYAVGDEPFGLEAALDKASEVCERVGIPESHTVLEFETQGAATSIPPDDWARGVRHSIDSGYEFRYWEVANEPYSGMWGHGGAFASADEYGDHFLAVSKAVRAVHPDGQIGLAINSGNREWGNYVLKKTAGAYDFVVAHHYCFSPADRRDPEQIALTENYRVLDRILRLNALIRAYNPDRDIYQYDTEWGMHNSGPDGERADYVDRNANIVGTLHRAVRLIYYAREGMLRGASSWQMLSAVGGQGFGVLFPKEPEARSMVYWLYYHLIRHMGASVLDISGSAPLSTSGDISGPRTPVLATLSEDGGTLYLVIANGSYEEATPCRATLDAFPGRSGTGIVLSDDDVDGKPLVRAESDVIAELPVDVADGTLSCVLPPHSVSFITIER